MGILNTKEGVGERAVYIVVVDPQNVIRFVMVTDLSVGRNPKRVLRILAALQTLCVCIAAAINAFALSLAIS